MEKTTNQPTNYNNELISLTNRKNLIVEGIVEIISSNDTEIFLKLKDTTLSITGTNINILKIDTTTGILQAEGLFNNIKYGKTSNFFKRIFK